MKGTGEGMSSAQIIELLAIKNSELEQQKSKLIELLKEEYKQRTYLDQYVKYLLGGYTDEEFVIISKKFATREIEYDESEKICKDKFKRM